MEMCSIRKKKMQEGAKKRQRKPCGSQTTEKSIVLQDLNMPKSGKRIL